MIHTNKPDYMEFGEHRKYRPDYSVDVTYSSVLYTDDVPYFDGRVAGVVFQDDYSVEGGSCSVPLEDIPTLITWLRKVYNGHTDNPSD